MLCQTETLSLSLPSGRNSADMSGSPVVSNQDSTHSPMVRLRWLIRIWSVSCGTPPLAIRPPRVNTWHGLSMPITRFLWQLQGCLFFSVVWVINLLCSLSRRRMLLLPLSRFSSSAADPPGKELVLPSDIHVLRSN